MENDYHYEPKLGHGLQCLGGIDSVVEQVQSYVFTPIRSKHLFREVNVKPSRGFLLVGSMGAGKTQLGFSILAEAKLQELNPYYVTSAQLLKDAE
jgi:ATP-dependent 26S proteasome regulatory subunit